MKTIKTITLHATNGAEVQLSAVDCGEWHPQTATDPAWGFLYLRLKLSAFAARTFRHRLTGRAALDILTQLDDRAPELPPEVGAFLDYVNGAIRNYRANGITYSKAA